MLATDCPMANGAKLKIWDPELILPAMKWLPLFMPITKPSILLLLAGQDMVDRIYLYLKKIQQENGRHPLTLDTQSTPLKMKAAWQWQRMALPPIMPVTAPTLEVD